MIFEFNSSCKTITIFDLFRKYKQIEYCSGFMYEMHYIFKMSIFWIQSYFTFQKNLLEHTLLLKYCTEFICHTRILGILFLYILPHEILRIQKYLLKMSANVEFVKPFWHIGIAYFEKITFFKSDSLIIIVNKKNKCIL